MKIVVFGAHRRVGALVGEQVVDLQRAEPSLPADLRGFIEAGPRALETTERLIGRLESAPEDSLVPLSQARLHAPWPERRIVCMGGNFADHLAGMERSNPRPSLDEVTRKARERGQWGFWKVPARVAGPHDAIPYPKRTHYLDYEGELAIIIGQAGKDIAAERISDHVWGVTLLNDWSMRDGMGSPFPLNYNLAKNFDGSVSMGPCIVVGELDPQDVELQTCINGEVRQHFRTRDMIFSFGEALAFLSRDFTFVAGDVIAGGTAAGTAADKTVPRADGTRPTDLFLKVGDTVELSSPQIGTLANRVVANPG